MKRILPRPFWMAGLLLALGCNVTPEPVTSLPGGETPRSFQVRPAPAPPRVEPPAAVTPVAYQPPTDYHLAAPQARTAPLPLPPAPAMACAADYRWLIGTLCHDRVRNRWSVHYADPTERFGGELELLSPGPMAGFAAGQVVRVEGELVDPEPFKLNPTYRVRSLQLNQPGRW